MSTASSRRVVVTGLGLISPLGNTVESLWEALQTGRSGVGRLTSLPTEPLPFDWGAEVADFTGHIADFGPLEKTQKRAIRKGVKVMCREIQMGVAAAQRALSDAGLAPGTIDPERTGVVYGSDYILTAPDEFIDGVDGCLDPQRAFHYDKWADNGLPRVTPLWLLKYLPNMPASHIAIYNDLRGPSNSLTMREASANLAVAEAARIIQRGAADAILAGSTGTRVHPLRTLHVLLQEEVATGSGDPTSISRPFDAGRRGMVLGEGAGALVLEALDVAERRGATIWGEIVGSGSSAVLSRQGVGDGRLAARNVLRQTLESSRVPINNIGHLHAHGISTRQGDMQEAQGIHDVFGERAEPLPVVALKSFIGHPGAGGGALELIASLVGQRHGRLFPVLNYKDADPDCPVHVVRSCDEPAGSVLINLSLTPQGQASALAIRSME